MFLSILDKLIEAREEAPLPAANAGLVPKVHGERQRDCRAELRFNC
jgi:hypothetical protein